MRSKNTLRMLSSVCLMAALAACGGSGDDDGPAYPAHNTVVVQNGTNASAAGTYSPVDHASQTRALDAQTVIETRAADFGQFHAGIDYLQSDTRQYLVWMEDSTGFYGCRSKHMQLGGVDVFPLCDGQVDFNAGASFLKFSNVTLAEDDGGGKRVKASANISW